MVKLCDSLLKILHKFSPVLIFHEIFGELPKIGAAITFYYKAEKESIIGLRSTRSISGGSFQIYFSPKPLKI